jgi:alanine-glyoxylate transaminase / serine-glyoxylate transaminase / serine-pyruvate transaminase
MPDARRLPELPELMIAGPAELHAEDLDVLGRQVIPHYGDTWTSIYAETIRSLGRLLGAERDPYIIPGTGTASLDAALFNLFEPGDEVVVPNTGFFGGRLVELATAHRLKVVEVPVEPGAPVDPADISPAIRHADGVLCCHVDTSTGVRHPIEEIARIAAEDETICVIDGISSAGGETLDVDAMGIHALVTGSQKGLEAPPGLGIVALGPEGPERIAARSRPPESWYFDLQRWDWYRANWEWHPSPVTMPTNLVLALSSSLRRIEDVGITDWVAGRAALARRCREGLSDLGLEPVPREGWGSNLVVAMWAPDPAAIQKHLAERGIMISGGLHPTMGKAIRVGLMGRTATEAMVDRVIAGVAEALGA